MKVQVLTETKLTKKKSSTKSKNSVKSLTLDEIEEKMMKLACDDTNDVLTLMLNEKKMNMLEKVANIKMHRLQLKALETQNVVAEVEPIEVKFISARTNNEKARIEHIETEVRESRGIKEDA